MKAARIYAPLSLRMEDIDQPSIGSEDVLIKVEACGVCGTDIHIYEGKAGIARYPVIPGHEFSGRIAAAGVEAARHVSIGDRVVIDPTVTCGRCIFCRSGRMHLCLEWSPIGVVRDGAFAEYVKVPVHLAYRIPDRVSFEEAALTEPLSCCIHGWDRLSPRPGFTTAVIGAGPIGLMHIQLARLSGASLIIASEPIRSRRILAEKLGADIVLDPFEEDLCEIVYRETSGVGVDIVVEAVGGARYLEESLKIASRGGKILVFGVAPEEDKVCVSPYGLYRSELTILGSFINPYSMDRAISMIASRRIDVRSLISHIISLNRLEQALRRELKDSVKVIVKP
ncbi:MAG: zinc-dependent alcohol dehydrogenase family protein [Candidatus Bathyarchaeota archaeon]|nr:zinc-dependent alcohol dehydrogenase family protein [Candidatus Bathyarchaeota archaeon]